MPHPGVALFPGASSKSRAFLSSAPAAQSQGGGRSPFKALRGFTVLTDTLQFVLSKNFSMDCLSLVSFQSPQVVILTILSSVILLLGEKMGRTHMRSRRPVNAHVCCCWRSLGKSSLGATRCLLVCIAQARALVLWVVGRYRPQRPRPIVAASWTLG